MKRDNDFIRQLLLEFEESDKRVIVLSFHLNMTPEEQKKLYHAELLCDAGLLLQLDESVFRMTNHGHDYLDAIRNDTIWSRTKSLTREAGGASLGMLMEVALALLKEEIKERIGVQIN